MKNHLVKIYNVLVCLLIASIVLADLFKAIPNILLALLAAIAPFVFQNGAQNKLRPYTFSYFVFLSIVLVSLLYQGHLIEDLKYIKGFFLLPVILLIIYNADKKYLSLFKASFVIPLFGMAIFMGTRIAFMYVTDTDFSFTEGEIVYDYIIGDRIYLGFYAALGAFLAFDLFRTRFYNRWIWLCLSILITAFIVLIGSRIGLIVWAAWVFFEIINVVQSRMIKWYHIAGFSVVSIIMISNTEMYDRLTYSNEYNEPFLIGLMEFEPRMEIWPCAINGINNSNVLFGQGFSKGQDFLVSCYADISKPEKAEWFIQRRYNSHNQYLNILMGSGALSLAAFIICNLLLIWHYRKSRYIGVILGTLLFLLIENVIFRQGGYYVIVLILFFASVETRRNTRIE